MKKIIALLSLSSLLLGACSAEEDGSNETALDETAVLEEETVEAETENAASNELETKEGESLDQQIGDVIEAEGGTRTIVNQVENINETQTDGPFEVTLLHSQLSQYQPSEDYVEPFGGENLALITFKIDVTNNSADTNTIYPNQGIVVTDSGHQIDADIFISDDVGGEFYGEVTKNGDVFFMYEGDAEEVSSVRYIIGTGHDENWDNFGEDLEFTVNFE